MRIKMLLFTLLYSIVTLSAQDARTILDRANQAFVKAGGIKATFELKTEDAKQKVTYAQDGTIDIKGDKFRIESPEGITWFDGKTQWTYMKGSDEVNVSNPSGEELAGISPSVLLNIYKKGYKLVYKGERKENTRLSYEVELIPLDNKADFNKLVIFIDKTNYLFTAITLYTKDGMINKLKIKKLQANVALADNLFLFNKKNYPNVELIDLR